MAIYGSGLDVFGMRTQWMLWHQCTTHRLGGLYTIMGCRVCQRLSLAWIWWCSLSTGSIVRCGCYFSSSWRISPNKFGSMQHNPFVFWDCGLSILLQGSFRVRRYADPVKKKKLLYHFLICPLLILVISHFSQASVYKFAIYCARSTKGSSNSFLRWEKVGLCCRSST